MFQYIYTATAFDLAANPSVTAIARTQILNGLGNILFSTGQTYYNNSIQIMSITLQEYRPDSAASNLFGSGRVIIAYRTVGRSIGVQDYTRDFRITVALNADFTMRSCSAVSGTNLSDNYWTQSPNLVGIYNVNTLGIGKTGNPATRLEISEFQSGAARGLASNQYSADAVSSLLNLGKARGTPAAPTAALDLDILGRLSFSGHTGTVFAEGAAIRSSVVGNFSNASNGANIIFSTKLTGQAVSNDQMIITDDGLDGIGLINPTNTLEVQAPAATLHLNSSVVANDSRIEFARAGTTEAQIGVARLGGGSLPAVANGDFGINSMGHNINFGLSNGPPIISIMGPAPGKVIVGQAPLAPLTETFSVVGTQYYSPKTGNTEMWKRDGVGGGGMK